MRRIIIAGGGLAGLTLGILLRSRGAPVEIWEAYDYPRHRVCGEFISGKGWKLLEELLRNVPGRPARTVAFHLGRKSTPPMALPSPALSIPRWTLDHLLAARFTALGGVLHTRHRWTEDFEREGLVRASGRILEPMGQGWTGLKFHMREVELPADLEMHFSDKGYAGLSRLPEGINVCALLRPGADVSQFRQNPLRSFEAVLSEDSLNRLRHGAIEWSSLCATTGVSFTYHREPNRCAIGDAHGMIPPFTGNGMSLAIESGFLAADTLTEYASESMDWDETVRRVDENFSRAFRRRYMAARALRYLSSGRVTQEVLLSSLRTVPRLLGLLFNLTR